MDREEFFGEARHDLTGPLAGVRVLDVTKVWSGPQASGVLADLGADVVKVELPGRVDAEVPPVIPGTGLSWFRQTVNRNKRSIGLDLRDDEDRATFLRMVAVADIVVENYRPGTLDGWGAGYPACREVRPDIVFVSISGYGQYGPRAHLTGYDPVLQAYGGWLGLNGEPDGQGVRAPTFIADELAALHGAIGALAALRHRERTGEGQHIDVAMLDSLIAGGSGLLTLAARGRTPQRWGNETEFVVPSNVYACADGAVYLVVALNRQWRALAETMGRADLARASGYGTATDRLDNRAAVNAVVAEWCAGRPAADVLKALDDCGVPASPVRDLAEVAADSQVAAREMLQETRLHDGSTAPLTGPAAKFSRTPTRIRKGAPSAGTDTDEVLRDWGLA